MSVSNIKRGSIPQQVKFRMLVGKTARENPDLPVDFVRGLLVSKHTDRALAEPFALKPTRKAAAKMREPL